MLTRKDFESIALILKQEREKNVPGVIVRTSHISTVDSLTIRLAKSFEAEYALFDYDQFLRDAGYSGRKNVRAIKKVVKK